MASRTMSGFAKAVMKEDFSRFYADLTPLFQVQTTPQKLLQTFGRFKEREDLKELEKFTPILEHPVWVDEVGELALSGYFSTKPKIMCFELTYKYTQNEWKLVSIHIFLEDQGYHFFPSNFSKASSTVILFLQS